jgi:hypothetical protein
MWGLQATHLSHGARASFLSLALACSSCGGRSAELGSSDVGNDVPRCVPGTQAACACAAGRSGIQLCRDDGSFGTCACDSASGSGGSDNQNGSTSKGGRAAGGNTSVGDAGSASGGAGADGENVMWTGTPTLIDVFVGEAGIYVVTSDSVALIDRTGALVREVKAPRPVTAAAFDDEVLVVADAAKLTSYDHDLKEKLSANLLEGCRAGVLLSGHRFVCGPENDWDRVFYTYDLQSGDLLASSKKYTYKGIPMRRVPGTDDFVTVTVDSSPSDFHLYSLAAGNEAVYVNESPYHGDFRVTNVYSFFGSPATHLVTDTGLMLRIYGADCNGMNNSFSTGCFVKDGALGTLTGAQAFMGMDADASGHVYGLVDVAAGYLNSGCKMGCLLQKVDVAARSVEKQLTVHPSVGKVVAFRYDAVGNSLVIGSRDSSKQVDSSAGYRVVVYSLD